MKILLNFVFSCVFWYGVYLGHPTTTLAADFGISEIIALILMIVATVISTVFRPRPIPPAAASLSDFQVPTAGEGRAIPEVIGTVRIKGPNVVWYGNPYTDPIPAPGGGSSGGGS
ncbi:hypothetical protein [Methylovulum miyakonense]|uniref:hypothetical protein n=1 Tax=Methylovulum miyakonense TaxID=645578 RepID=UPI0003677FB2|nr:hypothetical protein [Methylovulum miyakonense]